MGRARRAFAGPAFVAATQHERQGEREREGERGKTAPAFPLAFGCKYAPSSAYITRPRLFPFCLEVIPFRMTTGCSLEMESSLFGVRDGLGQ